MCPKQDAEWIKLGLDNEKEWRREMWSQMKDMHKRLDSFQFKVYTISGGMAVIVSLMFLISRSILSK